MNVAIATDADHPNGVDDDRSLFRGLEALGARVSAIDWMDPGARWASFDAVVVRSPWNYPQREVAFEQWLAALERDGARAWNPVPMLRWNLRKTYLLELAGAGLPVPPTLHLPAGSRPDLRAAIATWGRVVVKPEIGGTGVFIHLADVASRVTVERAIERRISEVGFLVQPFLESIHAGELSVVYLDGRYSHAVRKVAAGGEFLVHAEHGGTVVAAEPSPATRAVADRVAAHVPDAAFARVDLVGEGSAAQLVELELIDPELFLRFSPGAGERLAASIARRVGDRPAA